MIKNIDGVSCECLENIDLVCFSHLRWNFVFQRPNHLMVRFAKCQRVFFVEEPIFVEDDERLAIQEINNQLFVVTPHLKTQASVSSLAEAQQNAISRLFKKQKIKDCVLWYYTPMMLPFTRNIPAKAVVYDCMDELSAFKFAPAELQILERELLDKADVVFTGGYSIYTAKKKLHSNIHPFPSSIDKAHFGRGRTMLEEPADQQHIPHPRLGFFGVIDERFDIALIEAVAEKQPQWNFVIIGPVVKIDPQTLPKRPNIHYLGGKTYDSLPAYIAGWDLATIPFALNESTKFISPTKTPEYLAAGKPVISAGIADVIDPYGIEGMVHIADNPEDFITSAEKELAQVDKSEWLEKVDAFLAFNSWDRTWSQMMQHIEEVITEKGNLNLRLTEKKYV